MGDLIASCEGENGEKLITEGQYDAALKVLCDARWRVDFLRRTDPLSDPSMVLARLRLLNSRIAFVKAKLVEEHSEFKESER